MKYRNIMNNSEKITLIKYLSLLLLAFIIQGIVTVVSYNNINFSEKPLPDIFLDNISFKKGYTVTANVLLVIGMIAIIIQAYIDKTRYYAKKFVICYFIFGFLRASCVISTTLPVPENDVWCFDHKNMGFWGIISHAIRGDSCGDYLFSGHSGFATFASISFFKNNNMITRAIAICYYILANFFIILSSIHYSIDLWVGMYVSATLWILYSHYIPKKKIDFPDFGFVRNIRIDELPKTHFPEVKENNNERNNNNILIL